MLFAGVVMFTVLLMGGFVAAQVIFHRHTGRVFWRAMVPSSLRYTMFPDDNVELDAFMVMEEWAALIFYGSFMLLPLIALNVMGFVHIL